MSKQNLRDRIWGIPKEKSDTEKNPGLRQSLAALRHLPPFLKMVWQTHPGMALSNLILRLFQSGIPLGTLYVGKLIVDKVLLHIQGTDEPVELLWQLVAIEAGLVLIGGLLGRIVSLLDALLGDRFAIESSLILMDHASKLDLQQFEDPTFYDKLERARQQTTPRVVLLGQLLTQVQDVVSVIVLAAGLVVFNPWLILLLALAVIPAFLSESYFNRRSYSLTVSWTAERRAMDYLRFLGASDSTAKEVKIFGLNDYLSNRFRTTAYEQYNENSRLSSRRAFWGFLFNSLGDLGYYAAYVVIIGQTIAKVISLGDLTFLSGSFTRLRGLIQAILLRFSSMAQTALYLQDFFDFLAMEPIINRPVSPRPVPNPIKEGFVFENVGFQYPNSEKYAVRGLNFSLKAGEKLALVGENGAGKTTLVKLLARLYEPSEGRILLDGIDLAEYDPGELRAHIGVIFQDFVRFYFSASDNLAVGQIDDRANVTRIEQAAHQSLANTVIDKLPDGYNQVLGRRFEGGIDLSGGEWQKIALGRAYMREAQLLILDEPTAALDARAEFEVFERFAELTKNKTAVLISHRFSTVRMADRILVMQGGRQMELGSHEELLELKGLYSELFYLQAQGYK